jgi:soluble P-type ATPase
VKVQAELLPEQKVVAIEQAKKTVGPACMVGDGINDSPALASSDIGMLWDAARMSRETRLLCVCSATICDKFPGALSWHAAPGAWSAGI